METILQRAREALPRRHAAHHHRQRPAVHRQGLQGVHPHRRHDPRQDLALLSRSPTARSNAGTRPSRASASASWCRCPWTTPAASSPITSRITTPSACTAPSATSRPRTSSTAATRTSSPNATASWPRPANAASNCARPSTSSRQRQPAVTPRPAIDFAAVRAAVTMAAVLQLLGFQARSSRGGQQRGPCPLHGSTRGTSRCFSRQPGRSTPSTASSAAAPATPWTCGLHANRQTHLRRRPRPVPTPEHPAADLAAATRNREEEPVAPATSTCTMASSLNESPYPLPANSNGAILPTFTSETDLIKYLNETARAEQKELVHSNA